MLLVLNSQNSEYASICEYNRVLNMGWVVNMPGF